MSDFVPNDGPPSSEELEEIDKLPDFTDEIEIEDDEDDEVEEVEDASGITEENYLEFLPAYSDSLAPPINSLAPTGLFGVQAPSNVPYLDAPPEPQEGYEEGEGA